MMSFVARTMVGCNSSASAGDSGSYGSSSDGKSRGARLGLAPSETPGGDKYWELLEGSGIIGECTDGWWETKTRSMSSRASPIRAWRVLRLARMAMSGLTGGGEERTRAERGKNWDAFCIHGLRSDNPGGETPYAHNK